MRSPFLLALLMFEEEDEEVEEEERRVEVSQALVSIVSQRSYSGAKIGRHQNRVLWQNFEKAAVVGAQKKSHLTQNKEKE